jgi:hypothetical protein
MSKWGSNAAKGAVQAGSLGGQQDMATANGIRGSYLPIEESEMYNPIGLTPETMARAGTQSGEAGSARAGAGSEAEMLRSRGNIGDIGGRAVDTSERLGDIQQRANMAPQLEDIKLKEQERQAGALGTEKQLGSDISGDESSLRNDIGSINENSQSQNATTDEWLDPIQAASKAGGAVYGAMNNIMGDSIPDSPNTAGMNSGGPPLPDFSGIGLPPEETANGAPALQ